MNLLIKDGQVINFDKKDFEKVDILVQDGRITKIAKKITERDARVIDAGGCLVLPGLIDMHAHFREPGREDEEDILSGSLAALKGGFTTVCVMPNTEPPIDTPGLIKYLQEKATSHGLINIFPIGAITKGRQGLELSEMGRMKEAGALAFSDDGNWVRNSLLMRRAMEYSLMLDVPLILHCEDEELSKNGHMNEGTLSVKLGLNGIPQEAELIAVERDLRLAELTMARIHITHLTTRGGMELIKSAKEKGLRVSCDTCPHYLILNEEAVLEYNTNAKVKPPLRTERDRLALIEGLREGIIDCISTDHAPHSEEEKDCEFGLAEFGIIGLQSALGILFRLVEDYNLDLIEVIEKLSLNPARILNLKGKGKLQEGYDADILIFDPKHEWVLREEEILSRSKNTPFLGWRFKGKPKHVIVGGEVKLFNFQIQEVER